MLETPQREITVGQLVTASRILGALPLLRLELGCPALRIRHALQPSRFELGRLAAHFLHALPSVMIS